MEDRSQIEVKTLPGTIKKPISSRLKRRLRLVSTVMGVYVLSAVIIGGALFSNRPQEVAEAGNTEQLSTAIRFVEEKTYQKGDAVQMAITIQNVQESTALNNLDLEMLSTAQAVDWLTLIDQNGQSYEETQADQFSIPVLSPGERFELLVSGVLQEQTYDFLSVQGKFQYVFKAEDKEVLTNQVFTGLEVEDYSQVLPAVSTIAETFTVGQNVEITAPIVDQEKARIYVSDRDRDINEAFADCEISAEDQICRANFAQLPVGRYSAIVVDQDQQILSGIGRFEVRGETGFTPSSQAQMVLPFGNTSINGKVPVIIERALSKNEVPASRHVCELQILDDSAIIDTLKARVDDDRNCRFLIDVANYTSQGDIYTISLVGTEQAKFVSFVEETEYALTLNTQPPVLEGEAVTVFLEGVVEEFRVENSVMLGVWHPYSGEYQEYSSINGKQLVSANSEFITELPSSIFSKGGSYSIFARMEDGSQSDFLQLQFQTNKAGSSNTGIVISPIEQISAGNTFDLQIGGVTDISGEYIQSGNCTASLYTAQSASNSEAEIIGNITSGLCKVTVPAGTITKAGPVVATFSESQTGVSIDQTTSFEIRPGSPTSWGQLQFASEPLAQEHANVLIVGPVTDGFLNHAQTDSVSVTLSNGEEVLLADSIPIEEGFGQLIVPASVLTTDQVDVSVKLGEELVIQNTFTVTNEFEEANNPIFPEVIEGDASFQISRISRKDDFDTICDVSLIRSTLETVTESFEVSPEGQCLINWSPNQFRDTDKALLQLFMDGRLYHEIVDVQAGRPVSNFAVMPRVVQRPGSTVNIDLITSVLSDQHGKAATDEVQWQLNSQSATTEIKNGVSVYSVEEIRSEDVRALLDQLIYDVDIVGRASELALATTKNISINVGNNEIVKREPVEVLEAQTHIRVDQEYVFAYRVPACSVFIRSIATGLVRRLPSHAQGDMCYVQVNAEEGSFELVFDYNGHVDARFPLTAGVDNPRVVWCEQTPCYPQIRDTYIDDTKIVLIDDEQEFILSQDASEPLVFDSEDISETSEYTIRLSYTNGAGDLVEFVTQLSGSYLVQ